MSTRSQRRAIVKSLHAKRRELGRCIYDNRDRPGGREHGTPHKGGRCLECWNKKLESQAKQQPVDDEEQAA